MWSESVVNGLERSNIIWEVNLNMVYENPIQKQEKFYLGPDRSKFFVSIPDEII